MGQPKDKGKDIDIDFDKLLDGRAKPKFWDTMSDEKKLEYIATRILADDREGTTSHTEIKESGILSPSQYERRKSKEVYSIYGDLDSNKPDPGVFSRTHVRDIRGVRTIKKSKRNKEVKDGG